MRGRTVRGCGRWVMVAALGLGSIPRNGSAAVPVKAKGTGACQRGSFEGEVHAGAGFVQPIGGGLEVRLEALSWGSGWLLRVEPVVRPRLAHDLSHDYAELATPPYASVSPLLISTDYSFRAQDAVAWNPRRFRFAASAGEFAAIRSVYDRYSRATPPGAAVEAELGTLVSKAAEGTLQILDAKLIPGTANQAQMAAMVASHFSTTVHTIEEPREGGGSVLGKLSWLRFRVSLDLPRGFSADSTLVFEPMECR